jgi:hypothetical protein
MRVKVKLANPGKSDVKVGVGTTLIVAIGRAVTEAELEDTSAEAYGFIAQGVAVVPGAADDGDVAMLIAAQAGDGEPVADKPKPKRRRSKSDDS